jgi:CarD family transcriptional regulator
MCKNWSKRYRGNDIKIRNGDVFGISEIVKNLTVIDREKKLSTGEKRMLESARQLLVSELMLILDEPIDKVEEILREMIK